MEPIDPNFAQIFEKLLTMNGQFDLNQVMGIITPKKEIEVKRKIPPPPQSALTKPIYDNGRGKLTVYQRMWQRFFKCFFNCASIEKMKNACPQCTDWEPLLNGEDPVTIPIPQPPPPPGSYVFVQCVEDRCLEATGDPDCMIDGEVDGNIYYANQLICWAKAEADWQHKLDCWGCYFNARFACVDTCGGLPTLNVPNTLEDVYPPDPETGETN